MSMRNELLGEAKDCYLNVDQEKSIYNNLKNDINKISLTLKSL